MRLRGCYREIAVKTGRSGRAFFANLSWRCYGKRLIKLVKLPRSMAEPRKGDWCCYARGVIQPRLAVSRRRKGDCRFVFRNAGIFVLVLRESFPYLRPGERVICSETLFSAHLCHRPNLFCYSWPLRNELSSRRKNTLVNDRLDRSC